MHNSFVLGVREENCPNPQVYDPSLTCFGRSRQICRSRSDKSRCTQDLSEISWTRAQSTLSSMTDLALLLEKQDKYSEAEPIHRQALAIRQKVRGPEHPSTLRSIGRLARLLQKQGKFDDAEQLYREGLAASSRGRENTSPDTPLSLRLDLACLLSDQGKLV